MRWTPLTNVVGGRNQENKVVEAQNLSKTIFFYCGWRHSHEISSQGNLIIIILMELKSSAKYLTTSSRSRSSFPRFWYLRSYHHHLSCIQGFSMWHFVNGLVSSIKILAVTLGYQDFSYSSSLFDLPNPLSHIQFFCHPYIWG